MNKINIGDKVCFIGGQSLPQFFGGVYEVIGQTIYGIFNDEYVLADGSKTRRVHVKSIRHANPQEIEASRRIDCEVLDMVDVSPCCEVRNETH